jgi:peroxin-10
VGESEARVGYEVLGVLLVLQMSVQGWLHLHSTMQSPVPANPSAMIGGSAMIDGGVEVSLDPAALSSNNELLLESTIQHSSSEIGKVTNTQVLDKPRYDLRDNEATMGYIKGQNRKCTLCLEGLKDPSATSCGHVFCWECIGDWVREKPECPLCRREVGASHILPLRV